MKRVFVSHPVPQLLQRMQHELREQPSEHMVQLMQWSQWASDTPSHHSHAPLPCAVEPWRDPCVGADEASRCAPSGSPIISAFEWQSHSADIYNIDRTRDATFDRMSLNGLWLEHVLPKLRPVSHSLLRVARHDESLDVELGAYMISASAAREILAFWPRKLPRVMTDELVGELWALSQKKLVALLIAQPAWVVMNSTFPGSYRHEPARAQSWKCCCSGATASNVL